MTGTLQTVFAPRMVPQKERGEINEQELGRCVDVKTGDVQLRLLELFDVMPRGNASRDKITQITQRVIAELRGRGLF